MATNAATASDGEGPGRRRPQAANQRADARRNRSAILTAAATVLRGDPEASIADIAAEAGVGRMTVYGHFPTRPELVEAALVDVLERGEEVLQDVPLGGDPAEAFGRLIASSWALLDRAAGVAAAARRELPSERVRELHEKAEARVRGLLERGQREGAFRGDLSVGWLLATTHAVMNAAAYEVAAGRLSPEEAGPLIETTLRSAFAAR